MRTAFPHPQPPPGIVILFIKSSGLAWPGLAMDPGPGGLFLFLG